MSADQKISVRRLSGDEINYTAEAVAIQSALAGVSKVVQLGAITFFSSATGDAWMLDPADHFAVCLARDNETRSIPIRETADKLLIEWNADYRILGGTTFFVRERTGAAYEIIGYPIEMIDPDALAHIEDYLLAAGHDGEALRLAERFLAIERASENLVDRALSHRCEMIFNVRVGLALRAPELVGASAQEFAQKSRAGIETEIDPDAATMAAAVITGQAPEPVWTRAEFDFAFGDLREEANWREHLRFSSALVRVAQEAWRLDHAAPGAVFHGLHLLSKLAAGMPRKRREGAGINFLDFLRPRGLEKRLADGCGDIMGVNVPRARVLLAACVCLTRFAERHSLFSAEDASKVDAELQRLAWNLEPSA